MSGIWEVVVIMIIAVLLVACGSNENMGEEASAAEPAIVPAAASINPETEADDEVATEEQSTAATAIGSNEFRE